jgi:hypothetical protein
MNLFFSTFGIKEDFVPSVNGLRVGVDVADEVDVIPEVGCNVGRFRYKPWSV